MADDALWYEAALLVGVTNALNVVADSPLQSLEPASPSAEATNHGARSAASRLQLDCTMATMTPPIAVPIGIEPQPKNR